MALSNKYIVVYIISFLLNVSIFGITSGCGGNLPQNGVTMGNFFPDEYKTVDYKEGDMFAVQGKDGKFFISRILKIDQVTLREGDSINIMGEVFTAPAEDYLLIVSESFSKPNYDSVEDAQNAANNRTWENQISHIPRRATGTGEGTYIGNQSVEQKELTGYNEWKKAFDKGEAGIW